MGYGYGTGYGYGYGTGGICVDSVWSPCGVPRGFRVEGVDSLGIPRGILVEAFAGEILAPAFPDLLGTGLVLEIVVELPATIHLGPESAGDEALGESVGILDVGQAAELGRGEEAVGEIPPAVAEGADVEPSSGRPHAEDFGVVGKMVIDPDPCHVFGLLGG
jgi:hypothetical protein